MNAAAPPLAVVPDLFVALANHPVGVPDSGTVEKHLASAYRKLGTSRAELSVTLERAASPSDEAAPDAP